MAKTLRCRDVGVDCDYVVRGETEDEVLQRAAEHGREHHNIREITPETEQRIRTAIREE